MSFPTCQVRVVRFYVSWPPSPPPTDLNCKLVIAVVPAGPEQQAQDQSVPRRASTASARSQWSRPDPNAAPAWTHLWTSMVTWIKQNSRFWSKYVAPGPRRLVRVWLSDIFKPSWFLAHFISARNAEWGGPCNLLDTQWSFSPTKEYHVDNVDMSAEIGVESQGMRTAKDFGTGNAASRTIKTASAISTCHRTCSAIGYLHATCLEQDEACCYSQILEPHNRQPLTLCDLEFVRPCKAYQSHKKSGLDWIHTGIAVSMTQPNWLLSVPPAHCDSCSGTHIQQD